MIQTGIYPNGHLSSRANAFSVESLISSELADQPNEPRMATRQSSLESKCEDLSTDALDSMQAMQSRVDATENQESDDTNVELQMRELWQRFFELGTEMIITKAGR